MSGVGMFADSDDEGGNVEVGGVFVVLPGDDPDALDTNSSASFFKETSIPLNLFSTA